jgi:hypothetical protein
MKSSQALNFFQFDFYDPIEAWLEESFLKRFPLYSRYHIIFFVNRNLDLILSIFEYEVLKSQVLMFDPLFVCRIGVTLMVTLALSAPLDLSLLDLRVAHILQIPMLDFLGIQTFLNCFFHILVKYEYVTKLPFPSTPSTYPLYKL